MCSLFYDNKSNCINAEEELRMLSIYTLTREVIGVLFELVLVLSYA